MRRLVAGLAAGGFCLAAAVPAFAGTTVTLTAGTGTRQLAVLDLTGNPLTNLTLKPGVPQPFRVRVTDSSITNFTQNFSVSAVMNNLYLQNGSTYNYSTKIPSSDLSISYPTDPLSASGVSFADLPQVAVSGTLPTCATLVTAGILTSSQIAAGGVAVPLCTLVDGATALTVSGVDSLASPLATTVYPALTNLANLPFALSGNQSGAFTNADYQNGIGASDPAGGGAAGTALLMMQGVPGMTTALSNEVASAIGTLPATLTSATGSGSQTALNDLMSALSTSSTYSSLASALSQLSASEEVGVLNYLTGALVPPVLTNVLNETGTYNAFPELSVNPTGSVPAGTYQGTLTITLVQQ